MNEKPTVIATFDKCPNCGSTERLAESLAKEVKERGLMRQELENYVHILDGVIQDPQRASMLPIGSSMPAFTAHMDICRNCGAYYSVKILGGRAVKMPGPPPRGPRFSPS